MRTNRICMGLAIAALVAIFIYQVGFTKATNESSYKWGFKNAIQSYNCGLAKDDPNEDNCTPVDSFGACTSTPVTNITACEDGYGHGMAKASGNYSIATCTIYSDHCIAKASHNESPFRHGYLNGLIDGGGGENFPI